MSGILDILDYSQIIRLPHLKAFGEETIVPIKGTISALSGIVGGLSGSIADDYDHTATYEEGDWCIYNGKLYQCSTSVTAAENFNSAKWTETKLTDVIGSGGDGTTIVQIPSVVGDTFTYSGAEQGPVITGLDTTHVSVTGDAVATDAGTYTFSLHLKDTSRMVWNDLTTADKTYSYSITKAWVTIPSVTGSYTYDGTQKEAVIDGGANWDAVTVGGTTEATNAGTYTVTFTLKDTGNYRWTDQTTGAKQGTWAIAKAAGGVSLGSASVTLNAGNPSATVSISVTGDGTASAVSSDTGVATASLSGSTLTIASANSTNGTATVTVSVPATTNYTAASAAVSVTASFYVTLGIEINLSDSNPATWASYTDDAAGMTAGSSAFDDFSIFDIQSYTFRNGAEVKALSKTDCTKYADGTSASSDLTSGSYDIMTKFKRGGYYITHSNGKLIIKVTDDPNKTGFCYKAFQRGSTNLDEFYLGRYKGYIDGSGKLRSYSGVTPTGSKTISQFRTAAQANGNGYENSGFYQLVWRQCLYMIKYKAQNSQSAIGKGYTGASAVHTTGTTNRRGDTYGTQTATDHMILFGIEDFWGNIWEWIDGLVSGSSRNLLTATDNFNDSGSGYASTASGVSSDTGGYMTDVQGTNDTGFVYKEKNGSSTTYICDNGHLYSGCVARFGGGYSSGDFAGVCCLSVSDAASGSDANFGGRVMFLKKSA